MIEAVTGMMHREGSAVVKVNVKVNVTNADQQSNHKIIKTVPNVIYLRTSK